MSKVKEDLSRVRLEVDGKQAINQLGKLEMEAKELRIDMKNAKKGTDEYVAASKKLREVEKRIAGVRKEVGLTGMTMQQLSRYQTQLRREINNTTTRGTADYKKLNAELQRVNHTLARQRKEMNGTKGFFGDIKKELKSFAVLAVGALGVTELFSGLQNMISGSARLSDSISDVQKTTELTDEQVAVLMKRFKTFNTRTPRAELMALADEAGKMGMRGVEAIAQYVEETNELTTALGDLGEDAGLKVAKMAERFDVSMRQIGSGINAVADNTKATAPFITEFLSRLGGIANEVGIKAGDILGYGAAIDEMGLNVEMSSTALNKFFIDFTKKTEEFGAAAGFAEGELSKLVGEQGTNAGFLAFLQRLKEANPESAKFLSKLEQLGIDGARGSQVFLALSQNVDQLRNRQALANTEIAKGTSLTEEYNRKNQNFAGNLERIQKWFNSMFINGGAMTTLNEFVELWSRWISIPVSQKIEEERTQMNLLYLRISDANIAQEDRVKLIEELKAQYPQYLADIDAERITNNELAKSIREINEQMINKIIIQEKEEEISDKVYQAAKKKTALLNTEDELMREMVKISEKYNLSILSVGTTSEKAANLLQKAEEFSQNQQGRDGQQIGPTAELIKLLAEYQNTEEALNVLEDQNNALLEEKNRLMERLGVNLTNVNNATPNPTVNPDPTNPDPTNPAGGDETVNRYLSDLDAIYTGYQDKMEKTQADIFAETEAHLNEVIALHQANGLDIVALEKERDRIRLAAQKRGAEAMLKEDIEIANAKQMIAQGLSQSLGAAIDFIGNRQGELTGFQKLLTVSQIAIDSAAALAGIIPLAVKAAKNDGPAAPFTLVAYIASMAGTVLGAVAKAKNALSDANVPDWNPGEGDSPSRGRRTTTPRKSFFFGGYTGEGNMGSGDEYGAFAGAVHQREYVIPEVTVSDPYVANLLPAIEQIRQDNIRGISSSGKVMPMDTSKLEKKIDQLIGVVAKQQQKMKAYLVYSELEELEEEDLMLKQRYRAD